MQLKYFAKTDIGKKYKNNEDFFVLPEKNEKYDIKVLDKENKGELFVLCDGMGGGSAGEVASELSATWFFKEYYDGESKDVSSIIDDVNKRIYELSLKYEQYKGMGTTFLCGIFKDDFLEIYSVGDSRLYLLRDEKFSQITEDHSDVWNLFKNGEISKKDLFSHPRKNVITSAIGVDKKIEKINSYNQKIKQNDLYLFCSDGLSDMIYDDEIKKILCSKLNIEDMVDKLILKANENGGKDNITVILVST